MDYGKETILLLVQFGAIDYDDMVYNNPHRTVDSQCSSTWKHVSIPLRLYRLFVVLLHSQSAMHQWLSNFPSLTYNCRSHPLCLFLYLFVARLTGEIVSSYTLSFCLLPMPYSYYSPMLDRLIGRMWKKWWHEYECEWRNIIISRALYKQSHATNYNYMREVYIQYNEEAVFKPRNGAYIMQHVFRQGLLQ